MKTDIKSWLVRLLAMLMLSSSAFAQDRVPFRQEELDQMLAPVALYPDSLLTQVLMASTYPLEVVQAARWSRANSSLRGQDAVRAVESMDWDPSVKSLTAFPQILTLMDEKLDWTQQMGEAFLAQQSDVMDTVQGLRRRAEAAGNLRSNEQMRVMNQDGAITIEPPAPQVVYVPYYDPTVVYGPWWWAGYPPVYWAPPPAYYGVPAYRSVFLWGPGIAITAGFFFGHADWHRHDVTVVRNVVVNRTTVVTQPRTRVVWEHDPGHRRGVPFHNEAARERFERSRVAAVEQRERNDAPSRLQQPGSNGRTTEMRQQRFDERRDASTNRHDTAVQRIAPGGDVSRTPDTRKPGDGRNAEAPARRPEEFRGNDANRHPDNRERARQHERSVAPAPARVAPAPQPAPAAAPQPGPQRFVERPANGDGGRMPQPPQSRPRDVAPAPHPQASVPHPASRAENPQQHGGPGKPGNQRESTNRGGERRPDPRG